MSVGEMSVGEVSVGEMSVGEMSGYPGTHIPIHKNTRNKDAAEKSLTDSHTQIHTPAYLEHSSGHTGTHML